MDIQAGTGWHVTELVRFAKAGEPANRSAPAVSADVCTAARRLLERGDYSHASAMG